MIEAEKICPMCAETVKAAAGVCRHCGHAFDGRSGKPGGVSQIGCVGTGIIVFGAFYLIGQFSGPSTPATLQLSEVDQINKAAIWQQGAKSNPGSTTQAAPVGIPTTVAAREIKAAGHACGRVISALRLPEDGSIRAQCSNGRTYRVFSVKGAGPIAMNCEAASGLGVGGC